MSIQEECQYLLDNRYQILRKSEYFLDALPRILAENYLPSDADITRCYIRTTGIHATSFSMKGSESFTLLDFGGQRSERKKWINCFKDAGIVIFVASLDEYDEGLFEDPTINRMQEALALFDSIVNSRWFIETPMVLFLNKIDLFSEKISYSPLPREHFPDYRGGNDYDAALDFIINQYLLLNRTGRPIRIFVTSAVDEMQIKSKR
ncbi:alpha subunit of G-protein [Rhodocollybia butyracea]|uniref:Alpha subunit of G-protein n=1 Tax=Rhodocollybia butyracea TaxID=206335 RepID=A0A9P5PKP2_9AGAR|nr:alpha subunit of G-protein [Rhodocollybia butyracea]